MYKVESLLTKGSRRDDLDFNMLESTSVPAVAGTLLECKALSLVTGAGVAMFITAGLEHDCCPDMPTATTPVAAVFLRRLAAMQLGAHEYSGGGMPGNPALAKKRDREDRAEEASDVLQALNAELFARRSLHHLD